MIENIISDDEYNMSFDIKNIDNSLINSIRRIMIGELKTYGFKTEPHEESDVVIHENTGALHNEFLAHRIGMIPLNIKHMEDIDNYIFKLQVENDTPNILNVTTNDFKVYQLNDNGDMILLNTNDFFKPDPLSGDYILITKLRPSNTTNNEKIDLEAKLSYSNGEENSKYAPVSKATFHNMKDEVKVNERLIELLKEEEDKKGNKLTNQEKQKIKNRFDNFEAFRYFQLDNKGEPNAFHFEIESIGIYTCKEIFYNSIEYLKNKLDTFNQNLQTENNIQFMESPTIMNALDIEIMNEGHTLGNLLQSYLIYNFVDTNKLNYVGYKIVHPLQKKMILRIQSNNQELSFEELKIEIKSYVNECILMIKDILNNIYKQI